MSKPIYPPAKKEFEKVEIDTWINGTIVEVQERRNDNKKVKNKETNEWETRSVDEVRFVFELEGYKFKHYSRWMTRSLYKQANLYEKYLSKLCPGLQPDTPVDLDLLNGATVKTMWDEQEARNGSGDIYQFVANIKPLREIDITISPKNDGIPEKEGMPF